MVLMVTIPNSLKVRSHLHAGARARDTKRQGSSAPDMGIVALAEKLNYPGDLTGVLKKKERK